MGVGVVVVQVHRLAGEGEAFVVGLALHVRIDGVLAALQTDERALRERLGLALRVRAQHDGGRDAQPQAQAGDCEQ